MNGIGLLRVHALTHTHPASRAVTLKFDLLDPKIIPASGITMLSSTPHVVTQVQSFRQKVVLDGDNDFAPLCAMNNYQATEHRRAAVDCK